MKNRNSPNSSPSTRLKKSRNGKKNRQGSNLQTPTDRNDVVGREDNESDDSKNSDNDDAELSFQSSFKNIHGPTHLSIHNVSMTRFNQHTSSHDDLPNSKENMVSLNSILR